MSTRYVVRYDDSERINHWITALLFVLAALSGLAFFHPSLFFFSELFGGGVWTRILHPFLGCAVFIAFLGLYIRFWRQNLIVELGDESFRLKKSLETASKLGARFALIAGENELSTGVFALKNLSTGEQKPVPRDQLARAIQTDLIL